MNKKIIGILAGILITVTTISPAYAYLNNNPIRKLGRGVANAVFGCVELIAQPLMEDERAGMIAAFTTGIGRGVAYAVGRTLVGVFEVVTFPIPNPSVGGYRPLIEPEFVRLRDVDRE